MSLHRQQEPGQDDLLSVIDAIYGAATEPDLWPDVLSTIRSQLDLLGCNLIVMHSSLRQGHVVSFAGLDPAAVEEWSDWVQEDVAAAALRRQPLGTVVNATDCVPGPAYERTKFYNGLMRRYDLYHLAGTNLLEADGHLVTFGMHRAKEHPFDGAAWRSFRALLPHLRRAALLQARLSEAEEGRRELLDALDTLRVGAVLLDSKGGVLAANLAAREMAAEGDGLCISRDGIRGAGVSSSRAVSEAIAEAVATGCGRGFSVGGVARLRRPSGRHAYRVVVAPLGSSGSVAVGRQRAVAIAFVTDPEQRSAQDWCLLSRLFDFTPAESRIASSLLAGKTTAETARELRIQTNTVRAHLKRVYSKTETGTQAQLLELLYGALPPMRNPR